jgi:hypothetical protein
MSHKRPAGMARGAVNGPSHLPSFPFRFSLTANSLPTISFNLSPGARLTMDTPNVKSLPRCDRIDLSAVTPSLLLSNAARTAD